MSLCTRVPDVIGGKLEA